MTTPLCDLLGINLPIISAPMGPDVSGPELVAAVSNAGGLGLLQAQMAPPDLFRETIRKTRSLTDRPFGMNLLLPFPAEEKVAICIEERVPVVSFFWGDPLPFVERIHAAGLKVVHQVGSVAEARRSAEAGVDVIIAQGWEAGGHVAGEVSTMALVPRVVEAVRPTPVIAAGGIATGRQLVAALALGAQAVSMGTRFLASEESNAHAQYKARVVGADETSTSRTILFGYGWPNAPHRTLRTPFVEEWTGREERGQESRPDEPLVGKTVIAGQPMPVLRFMGFPPNREATGELDSMSLLMGQSAGSVGEIKPVASIIRDILAEASSVAGEIAEHLCR